MILEQQIFQIKVIIIDVISFLDVQFAENKIQFDDNLSHDLNVKVIFDIFNLFILKSGILVLNQVI